MAHVSPRHAHRLIVVSLLVTVGLSLAAQESTKSQPPEPSKSISERTARMKRIDGFFPVYWDEAGGRVWLEVPKLDTEVLHSIGFATGLGSNDIGIDRGALESMTPRTVAIILCCAEQVRGYA